MPDLPTETVTFLFTDIEGSTSRWDQHTAAMRTALAQHDAIVRAAIEGHRGVVFKTVGDAFYAAFDNALNAVDAALEAQVALYAWDWGEVGVLSVRMALHTGVAQARDGDYFGPPLNRVARILELADGGQVLLSQATYDLVCDELPPGVYLRDQGERQLRDLQRPEHPYLLEKADLTSVVAKAAVERGNYVIARPLLEQCLARVREAGDRPAILKALLDLGIVARQQGDYSRATTTLEEAVGIARDLSDQLFIAAALKQLGIVAHDQRDETRCIALLRESFLLQRRHEHVIAGGKAQNRRGRVWDAMLRAWWRRSSSSPPGKG